MLQVSNYGKARNNGIIRNSKPDMESLYGVQRLGLFGSYVREKQRKKSDIDILVTFSRDIDLFDGYRHSFSIWVLVS
ncbi:MAG TPA: nucleotidyltransferase domain-containing protein [Syntrophales bacterium]|nr:nucleotidyltransferase domain-containing protein [Syntrophales bacterium]